MSLLNDPRLEAEGFDRRWEYFAIEMMRKLLILRKAVRGEQYGTEIPRSSVKTRNCLLLSSFRKARPSARSGLQREGLRVLGQDHSNAVARG